MIELYKKQRKFYQQELLSGRIRMKLASNEAIKLSLVDKDLNIIDKEGFEEWLSIDFENKIEFYFNSDFKEIKLNNIDTLIPVDWTKDLIVNNLTFQKGIAINEEDLNYKEIGTAYLKGTEVWDKISSKRTSQYCDKEIDKKFVKEKDDYLFSLDGFNTKIGKGTIGLLTKKGIGIVSMHYYKLLKNYEYLFYVNTLETHNIQSFIIKNRVGTTVGSSAKHLKKIELIKPNSLLETKLISTNFEKLETLIDSKKELLEKYKKQRKFYQQELLSGRIRMKLASNEAIKLSLVDKDLNIIDKEGFENWLSIDFENKIEFYFNSDFKEEKINGRVVSIPNDWIKSKIGDSGNIITGNTPSTLDNQLWTKEETYFKWISTPNLNNGIIKFSSRFLTKKGKEKGRCAKKDSLLISCIGSIGECGILKEESFFNQQINAIEFNNNFNNFYIKNFFNYKKEMFKNYVPKSVVPALNKEEFKKFEIFNPFILEQTLIGKQLTKIDDLIESLEEEINIEIVEKLKGA